MKKLYTTLTTLLLMMAALVTNAQTNGKLANYGATLTYSFSGGTIISQKESNLGSQRHITCEVTPGTTITFQAKGSGKETYDKIPCKVKASISANTSKNPVDGKKLYSDLKKGTSVSFSYTVPKEAGCVDITADYATGTKVPLLISVYFIVVEGPPAPEPEPQPKPKQEEDCSCKCDEKPEGGFIDTHIRFNDFYGEVTMRPNWEEDDSYEFVDLDSPIYDCYRIKTEEESGAILGLEDMSTYVIKPESILVVCDQEEKVSRLQMIMGCLWGNVKKMMDGKTLDSEMSECVAGILGTIFALEESSQGSKVWVFAGNVEVANKKTGKKTTLNAGQNITVKGKNNNIQSFNIEDGAKQFGIPMDHITNHYTNKPISKINLESICKPNKVSDKNSTAGKKPTIGKKSSTDKNTTSDKNSNTGKKPTIKKKSSTDKNTDTDKNSNAGKKPTIGKKSDTSTPKGQYARYGVKCGIVKRVEDGGDIRMYYTTWWDDYGRLERSEITRCEEKVGGKWKSATAPQIKNLIVDDKHYMYSKSTGWKQLKNDEINFLGSGSKTVNGCKLEKNGTATVNGKPCDIFKGKRNDTTVEYYIWEGIPMKRVEKDSDGTMTTTIESIELPASVDASLFKIPNVKR